MGLQTATSIRPRYVCQFAAHYPSTLLIQRAKLTLNWFPIDFGCYYHECFLRGLPKLTCLVRRLPPNLGKSTPFAEGEPNFYLISDEYPLPGSEKMSSKTPRARAASLDAHLTLAEDPPSAARRGTSVPALPGDGDPKICHHSSSSIRQSRIPEASLPNIALPTEPSGGSPSHQTQGYPYPPPSNHGYPHYPFASNYPPTNIANQYYENYQNQGQAFSRGRFHPGDPSFQFSHLNEHYANQQFSGHYPEARQLNAYAKNHLDRGTTGSSSNLNPQGQKNTHDPFEPIPLSRSKSKEESPSLPGWFVGWVTLPSSALIYRIPRVRSNCTASRF